MKRKFELLILSLCLFCFNSCTNSCSANIKNSVFRIDSVLLYDKMESDEFVALRIKDKGIATYLYNDQLVQLNLRNFKKSILFDAKLLESIDFVDVLNKWHKEDINYIHPDVSNISPEKNTLLGALLTERKLINYWIDNGVIYLFVKASTPSLVNNIVIAGTSKFMLKIINSKIISVTPLKCNIASISLENASIYMENNVFYFPTLPILFKDSISSFTVNRPSLIVSYQIDSGNFSIINLKMTEADLNSYMNYMQKTESNYCSYVNIGIPFKFNDKLCFSDTKNFFYSSNLNSPIYDKDFLSTTTDVISVLPINNTNTGDVLLFYKGERNEIDAKVTMTLNALNTCDGKVLQQKVIDYSNKCSNVTIYKESAYYIVNNNDKLYWVKTTFE